MAIGNKRQFPVGFCGPYNSMTHATPALSPPCHALPELLINGGLSCSELLPEIRSSRRGVLTKRGREALRSRLILHDCSVIAAISGDFVSHSLGGKYPCGVLVCVYVKGKCSGITIALL